MEAKHNNDDDTRNGTNPKRFKKETVDDAVSSVQQLVDKFGTILSTAFQSAIQVSNPTSETSTTTTDDTDRVVQLYTEPFPYGILRSVFTPEFLQTTITEIKDNSVVHFKESDLFKVYQSIDLANIQAPTNDDVNHPQLPSVLQLRSMLYSTEFRHYIEELYQLPHNTLNDQIDCACNCHMTGCHLLCHDDVIGTRKISYILYLTEADPIWDSTEGGALELYNSFPVVPTTSAATATAATTTTTERRIPEPIPCQYILPIFNTMALFPVVPGYSFHSVQEVFGSRPRLSIQGWYHSTIQPMQNIELSTLQRLKSYQNPEIVKEEDTEGEYVPLTYPIRHPIHTKVPTLCDSVSSRPQEEQQQQMSLEIPSSLSEEDRMYLKDYIRETYLSDESIRNIRERFEQDSSIQLRDFLTDGIIQPIQTILLSDHDTAKATSLATTKTSTMDEYYNNGVSEEWKTIGPAHKQRFLEYNPSSGNTTIASNINDVSSTSNWDIGSILYNTIRCQLLQSISFMNYLAIITNIGYPTSYRGRVRRFRPGRDYTVAHYGLLTEQSVLDATLCFVKDSSCYSSTPITSVNNTSSTKSTLTEKDGIVDENMEEIDDLWQSGDCGGFECYISADDDENDDDDDNNNNDKKNHRKVVAAADEYNADDDTELLNVSASNNTLSLVYRDPGTMRFIKYVSSIAPSSRYDVAMEYQVPVVNNNDDEDDDDDDDEEYNEDDAYDDNDHEENNQQ